MKTTNQTADQKALRMLLSGDSAGLVKLAGQMSGAVECPDCGHAGPHDDNGDRQDLSYLCAGCGFTFDAVLS